MANQTTMKNIVSYETGTSRYRNTMCFSVGTDSPCPHGNKCKFAHSESELKPKPQHNALFKTRMCNNASNCSYGKRCRFAHSPNEIREPPPPPPCHFGDKCPRTHCNFSHPASQVEVETPNVLSPPIKVEVPKWIAALKKDPPVESGVSRRGAVEPNTSDRLVDDPVRIRVHKDMAMEVFKTMLERGDTSISFELV